MRALYRDEELYMTDVPEADLLDGYVRVRVLVAAITGLDLDMCYRRHEYRGIPGTSFVGVVERAQGAAGSELMGQRVVGKTVYGCGGCDACRTGEDYRCRDRVRPGQYGVSGAHAEYLNRPARALIAVPEGVSDEAAALAAPVAAVFGAIERPVGLPQWTNVLVVGDGGMGLLAALSLAAAGYTVTLRGKHGDRFDLMRRHGIHFNLATDEAEISGSRPGRFGPALSSYPYVFEATGHPSGWDAASHLVSPGGTMFLLSSSEDGIPRPLTDVLDKNIHIVGLREGSLEPVLRVLKAGLFDPTEVVSQIYPLEEAVEAYARVRERRDRLALLRIGQRD